MATIRIGKEFLEHVEAHISRMRADDIKFKLGVVDWAVKYNSPSEFATALLWGPHLHLVPLMPAHWATVRNHLYLKVEHHSPRSPVTIRFESSIYGPPKWENHSAVDTTLATLADPTQQAKYPEVKLLHDAAERLFAKAELDAKWDATAQAVKAFFLSMPSVNTALKEKPEMRLYVPRSYLDKMDKPDPRTKRVVTVPEGFDAASLAAQAVEVQMARAINN